MFSYDDTVLKKLGRLFVLARRFFRIYILRPSFSRKFLNVSDLPVNMRLISSCPTADQPKQVAFHSASKRLLVPCMRGKVLQAFTIGAENTLSLEREWSFPLQCVEVLVWEDLCFVTMTNFKRFEDEESALAIIDLISGKVTATLHTGGQWSKVIAKHPTLDLIFISNWRSHDVSVIDISDIEKPVLVSVAKCGECPRGLAFSPRGECLVTGFYSGRIYRLSEDTSGSWVVVQESGKIVPFGYMGNPRDIIIQPGKENRAFVSNLGRNEVYVFDVGRNVFVSCLRVGREPNALRFLDSEGKILLVSCRGSNSILQVDTSSLRVVGRSEETHTLPTGMTVANGGVFVTCFEDNVLQLYG